MRGQKHRLNPDGRQRAVLNKWIGAQDHIYNAKCEEDEYFYKFDKKFAGTPEKRPKADQAYSHLKQDWMNEVPSQILRNGAFRWINAKKRFFKNLAKNPRKRKGSNRSVLITNELFSYSAKETSKNKKTNFIVSLKLKDIGTFKFNTDINPGTFKSLVISRTNNKYFISFCVYEDIKDLTQEEVYKELKRIKEPLVSLGIDRGVIINAACSDGSTYFFDKQLEKRLKLKQTRIKRFQRKLKRQIIGSKDREKTKSKLLKLHAKKSYEIENFNHHISKEIVNKPGHIIAIEDLKLKNMTKSASGTIDNPGKNVAQKRGLNRSIISKNLGQLSQFICYKALRAQKLLIKVKPYCSSQECSICGHSDKTNRLSQDRFCCKKCGHSENADINASKVIAKRGLMAFNSGDFSFIDKPKKKVSTRGTRGRACGSKSNNLGTALVRRGKVNPSHAVGEAPFPEERVAGTGTEDILLVPERNSGL